ncbi:hypothetical protein IU427_23655 [Nocardia beijingensis]|uniref:hypothetical protein n=1 Tax=Nocardia beijingensis TaxID=95162 RepID=UPI00189478EE|nr:hypothetical protein [Nocardia beijingensis]MBF6468158.1 hypothetical protein [Nocardia beijingensis]
MQIWQAAAGELDRHLKRLASLGLRRKARQHKIVLRAMMQIAVRHGVLDVNPIDGVSAFTGRGVPARGTARYVAAVLTNAPDLGRTLCRSVVLLVRGGVVLLMMWWMVERPTPYSAARSARLASSSGSW